MKAIETILQEEMYQLKNVVSEAKKRLEKAPKGHLRVMKKRDKVEYYYKSDSEASSITDRKDSSNNEVSRSNNGRYMRKSEIEFVKKLAQRDYDIHVVKNAEERIKTINTFLKKYDGTSLKEVYHRTNQYRRNLIHPFEISDDEYIQQWQAVEYKGKSFGDDENEIITERGERVRSKSEKIIADKLYALGIPYRYEYPLTLEGNVIIYPDFTILRMPAREEVYLEHLGMMGDIDYVNTVMYKLNTYERNGIYLGINLFITYETNKKALNTRTLDELIRKLFCVE